MFSSLLIFLIFHTLYFTKLKLKLKYQKKKMFLDARCSLIFIENNSSIHYKYYISLIYPSSSFPFPSHFSSFSFCTETNLIVPVYSKLVSRHSVTSLPSTCNFSQATSKHRHRLTIRITVPHHMLNTCLVVTFDKDRI